MDFRILRSQSHTTIRLHKFPLSLKKIEYRSIEGFDRWKLACSAFLKTSVFARSLLLESAHASCRVGFPSHVRCNMKPPCARSCPQLESPVQNQPWATAVRGKRKVLLRKAFRLVATYHCIHDVILIAEGLLENGGREGVRQMKGTWHYLVPPLCWSSCWGHFNLSPNKGIHNIRIVRIYKTYHNIASWLAVRI